MATASKIDLSDAAHLAFAVPDRKAESARTTSELLQENHDKFHIFFSPDGFHEIENHTVHHLLSLYALGASPETIQKQYLEHKKNQRDLGKLDMSIVEQMHDVTKFKTYLNDEKNYHNYLEFFRQEIEKKGYQQVVIEYLLIGDERADDLLSRLYGGFLHPIIHLGFGIEFGQPAIIAEALAQAALHNNYLFPFYTGAEKLASKSEGAKSETLASLLDQIRADKKLSTAAHWTDGNKIRDGILQRAPQEMIEYASRWTVSADDLEEKTAEMINAVIYYTGGAQHPPKQVKYDFYFMHCVNASIFFTTFMQQPWLDVKHKIRLLEWKARTDLTMYAARRSPEPRMDEVAHYQPKDHRSGEGGGDEEEAWHKIFERVTTFPEDGHACKLVRAIAHGQQACRRYEDGPGFRVKDDMWLKLGHMAIDSVQDTGKSWVRSAGFDEAWVDFQDRPRSQL